MTKVVMVVPYIYKPYFDEFRETFNYSGEKIDLFPIDNTGAENTRNYNRGVAESWNKGIDMMRGRDADWLIICSATMRLGTNAISQMFEQLKTHPYAHIIHFAKKGLPEINMAMDTPPPYVDGVFYWHLTAVRADVFDKVGYFDPNFYPIYFEDTDWDLRYKKAYADPQRFILPIDAESAGLRHGVEKTGLKTNTERSIAYFATKWGRHPSAVGLGDYDTPFDDPANSIKFFPPARGRQWDG